MVFKPASGEFSFRVHGTKRILVLAGQAACSASEITRVEEVEVRSDPNGPAPLVTVIRSRPKSMDGLPVKTCEIPLLIADTSGIAIPRPEADLARRAKCRSIANTFPSLTNKVSNTPSATVNP